MRRVLLLLAALLLVSGCQRDAAPRAAETTPEASPVPSPVAAAAFGGTVRQVLGPLNREGPPRVGEAQLRAGAGVVRLALNDAPTEDELRQAAAADVLAVLEVARRVDGLQRVQIVATYPLVDKAGTRLERKALDLTYSAQALTRLKAEVTDPARVFAAADAGSKVHPFFRGV